MSMRFDNIQVEWIAGEDLWTLNEDVTLYSCMVCIWGYNSYGIWTHTNLYRPYVGEPQHMGGALMNQIYSLFLETNDIEPMHLKSIMEDQFGFSGTVQALERCKFLYEIIPSHKSIKGWKILTLYNVDKEVWEFKKEEDIDLKQYKKIKPVEFLK